jgi:hypothetical protein
LQCKRLKKKGVDIENKVLGRVDIENKGTEPQQLQ